MNPDVTSRVVGTVEVEVEPKKNKHFLRISQTWGPLLIWPGSQVTQNVGLKNNSSVLTATGRKHF